MIGFGQYLLEIIKIQLLNNKKKENNKKLKSQK
jgi:hypothetical protein